MQNDPRSCMELMVTVTVSKYLSFSKSLDRYCEDLAVHLHPEHPRQWVHPRWMAKECSIHLHSPKDAGPVFCHPKGPSYPITSPYLPCLANQHGSVSLQATSLTGSCRMPQFCAVQQGSSCSLSSLLSCSSHVMQPSQRRSSCAAAQSVLSGSASSSRAVWLMRAKPSLVTQLHMSDWLCDGWHTASGSSMAG